MSSPEAPPALQMKITDCASIEPGLRDAWLTRLYEEILRPHFPDNELVPLPDFLDGAGQEPASQLVVAATDDSGRFLGGIVGDWYPGSRTLLIAYLAVSAHLRGRGVGTRLVEAAVTRWADQLGADLVIAEVEDPRVFSGLAGQDPEGRLSLYGRLGADLLDMPYIQPEVNPGAGRVRDMLLIVASAISPAVVGSKSGSPAVPSELIAMFLTEYFSSVEGAGHDDEEFRALVKVATDRPLVPLRPLHGWRDQGFPSRTVSP